MELKACITTASLEGFVLVVDTQLLGALIQVLGVVNVYNPGSRGLNNLMRPSLIWECYPPVTPIIACRGFCSFFALWLEGHKALITLSRKLNTVRLRPCYLDKLPVSSNLKKKKKMPNSTMLSIVWAICKTKFSKWAFVLVSKLNIKTQRYLRMSAYEFASF